MLFGWLIALIAMNKVDDRMGIPSEPITITIDNPTNLVWFNHINRHYQSYSTIHPNFCPSFKYVQTYSSLIIKHQVFWAQLASSTWQSRLGGPWGNLRWDRAIPGRGVLQLAGSNGCIEVFPDARDSRDPMFGRNSEWGWGKKAQKIPKNPKNLFLAAQKNIIIRSYGLRSIWVRVRNTSDLWQKSKDPAPHFFVAGDGWPCEQTLSVWRGSSGRFSDARPTSSYLQAVFVDFGRSKTFQSSETVTIRL